MPLAFYLVRMTPGINYRLLGLDSLPMTSQSKI